MIRLKNWFGEMTAALVLAALATLACIHAAMGQPAQHLSVPQPGGMPGLPVFTGIGKVTNGINVTWDGPAGYYQLFKKASLNDQTWLAVGGRTNLLRNTTVSATPSNEFFWVLGPLPHYLGSQACAACHGNIYSTETNTLHPGAFTDALFKAEGGQTNSSCLPCHTVGYGLPTGFAITNKNGILSYSTNLAGVQCENCHGPAANHAANEFDPTVRPRVELAATVCGGCHNVSQRATYNEWKSSQHAGVDEDVLATMNSSTNSLSGCGRCHSGSVRLSLLKHDPLPVGDANVAIVCVVCHDPHQTNGYAAQLRNPMSSTNDYSLTTSTNFTSAYNPKINVCGQCHNDRGAAWTDTSRAPHHSLQYNFLTGSVGEFLDGAATFVPGSHAGLPDSARYSISGTFYLTNQCVSCHMQEELAPSDIHNHTFEVASHDVCMNCHLFDPGQSVPDVSNRVSSVIFLLNRWAALKAPAALQTNGAVIWEYTTPGGLVWKTNSSGFVTSWTQVDQVNFSGPDAAGQALIPANIKKARFNLYLLVNDGSFGLHNSVFARGLLIAAEDFVAQELSQ